MPKANAPKATARPAPWRGVAAECVRYLCVVALKFGGWRMRGDWPKDLRRCVLLAAPHTSNWDGFWMLAAAGFYRVKLRWMGKRALVVHPFGFVLRWTGIVPVDRGASHDMVGQMRRAFEAEPWFVLAISPEGTREPVPVWKRGFYHIAQGAGVPVLVSVLDYGTKTISLAGMIIPSGDIDADFAKLRGFYTTATGKRPENFVLDGGQTVD